MAVVSKDAADTVSLRGGMLEVAGESDFTAEPVAPAERQRNTSHQRTEVSVRNEEEVQPWVAQKAECELFDNGSFVFR